VQQTDALFLGVQHADAAVSGFFSNVTLLFVSTGISVCVSIFQFVSHIKTAANENDAENMD
jgi:hypothetical protein